VKTINDPHEPETLSHLPTPSRFDKKLWRRGGTRTVIMNDNTKSAMLLRARRAVASFCMLTFCAIVLGGCSEEAGLPPRTIMIFIDMSLSTIKDRENYKNYMGTVVRKLRPGDKLTVCKIIDLTIADFTPLYQTEIPKFDFWKDNRTLHDKLVVQIHQNLVAAVDSVLDSRERIANSEIINSFLICEQYMRNKTGRKTMIVLSDMLECSNEMNFEKERISAAYVERSIRILKAKGRLPKLNGLEVWVAGAYAKNTEQYFAVQGFWNRFIEDAGAVQKSYSHALLEFE